jgi:mono/diheme cytochrome c family protein
MKIVGRWLIAALVLGFAADADAGDADVKASYDKMCASCHGADGRGSTAKAAVLKVEPVLLDLGREAAKAIAPAEKRRILLEGKAKMPGYAKKLAATEVEPMLAYCETLASGGKPKAAAAAPAVAAPPPVATTPPPAPKAPTPAAAEKKARAAWTKRCASCHGADGAGKLAKAKRLKVAPAELDLGRDEVASLGADEVRAIIAKGKGKMPAFARKLKAADLELLTAHAMKLAEIRQAKRR